jgi:hypothetical protein
MPTRTSTIGAVVLTIIGIGVILIPAQGQQIHRHGFAGRQTVLIRGDANVRAEEKVHDISDQSFKSQPASEHLQLVLDAGAGDAAFVHYFYETPKAPVSPLLTASVWVRSTKPGVELRARVVFPKEPDPARPETPLTMLIIGKAYERKNQTWDKLTLENVPELVARHLAPVRAKIGRDVNTADAYIDRLVLNVYTGPGPVNVWVDDLDIGPVLPTPETPSGPGAPGVMVGQTRPTAAGGPTPLKVEQRGGQLRVDGKPRFFKAIRHTGAPLHVLQMAGFDTVWFPPDVSAEVVKEAGYEGWLVIPSTPPADLVNVSTSPRGGPFDVFLDAFRRKFADSSVLFVDLGGGLTDEQAPQVRQAVTQIREKGGDGRRLVGGDLWDGYQGYSNYLDVVGGHRWPLFTSLDLTSYRDWLIQRRVLAGGKPLFWTWIQNHIPDWYATSIATRSVEPDKVYAGPIGPHPEQVRLLTYISLAVGCKGVGFWSDRALSEAHDGRDRLQGMALINAELDLISPLILSAGAAGGSPTKWFDSRSHPKTVKVAILSGQKGLLMIPMWLGPGDQFVPAQGAAVQLKIVIPGVPDGFDPWQITPAGVKCLKHRTTRVPDGLELVIDEFDLVTPIVFTDDQKGLVVEWQNRTRITARPVARWAIDLAGAEYEKVVAVHKKLETMGVQVPDSTQLVKRAHDDYIEAEKQFAAGLYDVAYENANRALRPLRVLMREHWQRATATLDLPTASPYAVSFFSLPQHWELAREVQASQPAPSVLPHGDFELADEIPLTGAPINPPGGGPGALRGWSAWAGTLPVDQVKVSAGVVRSAMLEDYIPPKLPPKTPKTVFSSSRPVTTPDETYVPPAPELGKGVLKLEIAPTSEDGKPLLFLRPLERTFLSVYSPAVRLPAGTLVRVSGWMKVPKPITGTADGAMMYDDAGGEPLAVRVLSTVPNVEKPGPGVWKHFHLYRRVPASGQIAVTLALTGYGVAYFNDIKIEPLVPSATASKRNPICPAPKVAPGVVSPVSGVRGPIVPTGSPPR